AYSGELAVTITAPEAIVVKSVSPSEDVYLLKTIELTLNKEVVAVENATATIELKDAEGAVVATATCAAEGNMLTLTLDKEITTPGEYTIVIPEGVVVGAAIGDAFSAEVAITVEEFDVYEPRNIGNKTRSDRAINSVGITSEMYGASTYELTSTDKGLDYVNVASVAEPVSFKAEVGETLTPTVDAAGSWVHFFVFVDKEGDGFTAGVAEDGYTPTGDLVAYSFYNNDAASDERGWNSVGQSITGDSRNKPSVPAFTAPAEAGTYRLRFKQDWCNIDPQGDADGKFGDFKHNGGQIIDLLLVVTNTTGISEVKGESGEVKGAYDLTGRKLEQITAPGVYIVNGKKVLVK
ncbi:MAG: Ig-like domain-containing protein, partial [Bacteroidaceae bacterium]|nr:Ig-like domain-containing protein [Bacteroidaceae bacterium]